LSTAVNGWREFLGSNKRLLQNTTFNILLGSWRSIVCHTEEKQMSAILNSRRLSMYEVAKLLNVHVSTIWRWYLNGVRGRKLSTILIGGRRFVRATDLDAFLAGGGDTTPLDSDLALRAAVAGSQLDARGVRVPSQPESPGFNEPKVKGPKAPLSTLT